MKVSSINLPPPFSIKFVCVRRAPYFILYYSFKIWQPSFSIQRQEKRRKEASCSFVLSTPKSLLLSSVKKKLKCKFNNKAAAVAAIGIVIVFDLFLSFAISLSSVKVVVGGGGMEQEEEERQMTYGIYSEGPPTLWALIYLCISTIK